MPAAPRDKLASDPLEWAEKIRTIARQLSIASTIDPAQSAPGAMSRGAIQPRISLSFQSGTGRVCNRLVLMRIAYENVERHAVPLQAAGKQFFSDGAQRELCRSSTRPPHRRKPIATLSPPVTIRAAGPSACHRADRLGIQTAWRFASRWDSTAIDQGGTVSGGLWERAQGRA